MDTGISLAVTQVTGELAAVDILDPSKVAWTCWGCFYTNTGLGLRMVKELIRPVSVTGIE